MYIQKRTYTNTNPARHKHKQQSLLRTGTIWSHPRCLSFSPTHAATSWSEHLMTTDQLHSWYHPPYCNSLPAKLPPISLVPLRYSPHRTRVPLHKHKSDHATPLLSTLQWLPSHSEKKPKSLQRSFSA